MLLLPFLLGDKSKNLQVAVTVSGKQNTSSAYFAHFPHNIVDYATHVHTKKQTYTPAVLRLGDGVGAPLAVVLGHIFTLLEGGCLILQDVPDTESIAI